MLEVSPSLKKHKTYACFDMTARQNVLKKSATEGTRSV